MSRSVPTLSASYSGKSEFTRHKREKVIEGVLKRKELPISVYYRTEASRKRKMLGKQYKSWDYYADNDIDKLYTEVKHSSRSTELPEVFTRAQTGLDYPVNVLRRGKRVAFDVIDAPFYPERLPNITPVTPRSRNSTREKMSAMTIFAKGSPLASPRKETEKDMFPKNINEVFREYWQDDGDTYKISFRQDTRGNYDPNSELHSDYYSVSRVNDEPESKPKTKKLSKRDIRLLSRPKAVTFPSPSYKFNAMMIGTTKTLHEKHHLDDRYYSESIEELVNSGLAYHMGYTSIPLLRKNPSW
ncbi:hypothetical protein KP79_PYT06440 [Mizuhopecten yessoensis]|uniref:Uncharacterized protein n=1 Tax=Mizuhopecten yessoensis TaxID=6573 RepID=A0A210R4T0_MIZYE|nr:hypothetical protein KP79_PYT06440 [Mizuhopecten yessoensis]